MGNDFQCVFSAYNKTKPIENKIPRDWEITKLRSLRAILHSQTASKSLNGWSSTPLCSASVLHPIPPPLSGKESLILGASWVKLDVAFSPPQNSPAQSFSSSNYHVFCSCSFFQPSLSQDLSFLFISVPQQPSPTQDIQVVLGIYCHDCQSSKACASNITIYVSIHFEENSTPSRILLSLQVWLFLGNCGGEGCSLTPTHYVHPV